MGTTLPEPQDRQEVICAGLQEDEEHAEHVAFLQLDDRERIAGLESALQHSHRRLVVEMMERQAKQAEHPVAVGLQSSLERSLLVAARRAADDGEWRPRCIHGLRDEGQRFRLCRQLHPRVQVGVQIRQGEWNRGLAGNISSAVHTRLNRGDRPPGPRAKVDHAPFRLRLVPVEERRQSLVHGFGGECGGRLALDERDALAPSRREGVVLLVFDERGYTARRDHQSARSPRVAFVSIGCQVVKRLDAPACTYIHRSPNSNNCHRRQEMPKLTPSSAATRSNIIDDRDASHVLRYAQSVHGHCQWNFNDQTVVTTSHWTDQIPGGWLEPREAAAGIHRGAGPFRVIPPWRDLLYMSDILNEER